MDFLLQKVSQPCFWKDDLFGSVKNELYTTYKNVESFGNLLDCNNNYTWSVKFDLWSILGMIRLPLVLSFCGLEEQPDYWLVQILFEMNLVNILHLRHNNCLSWLQIWRVKRKILFGPILWGSLGTCEETWRVTTTGCWFVVVIVVDLHRLHSHEYSVWNFIFEENLVPGWIIW